VHKKPELYYIERQLAAAQSEEIRKHSRHPRFCVKCADTQKNTFRNGKEKKIGIGSQRCLFWRIGIEAMHVHRTKSISLTTLAVMEMSKKPKHFFFDIHQQKKTPLHIQELLRRFGKAVQLRNGRLSQNAFAIGGRGPFLTSHLGANFDTQGLSCPPGVNFVPCG
jgi:hypothetical protein